MERGACGAGRDRTEGAHTGRQTGYRMSGEREKGSPVPTRLLQMPMAAVHCTLPFTELLNLPFQGHRQIHKRTQKQTGMLPTPAAGNWRLSLLPVQIPDPSCLPFPSRCQQHKWVLHLRPFSPSSVPAGSEGRRSLPWGPDPVDWIHGWMLGVAPRNLPAVEA